MVGNDALVNVASVGFGHAPTIVSAAEAAGIRRAVFVSTTAIFTALNAGSKSARMAAEDTIRSSSLETTILRPTMIYGSSRDRNMCRLIRFLSQWRVVPVFGKGTHLQQPVHVRDVAWAVANALVTPTTIGREYNISGAFPLTYNDVIDTITAELGRRVTRCHLPVRPVTTALTCFEALNIRMPLKAEQIARLNEDKAFEWSDAARDFGYSPRTFESGIREELCEMGFAQPHSFKSTTEVPDVSLRQAA